jgi:hypothetical protein
MSSEPTLFVCWGLFRTPRPGHPCRNAYDALLDAGHTVRVVRCYGWGALPAWLNLSRGRRDVRRLTGRDWVPVLLVSDGTVVAGSEAIATWSKQTHQPRPQS